MLVYFLEKRGPSSRYKRRDREILTNFSRARSPWNPENDLKDYSRCEFVEASMSISLLPSGVLRSYGEDLSRIPLRHLQWPTGEHDDCGTREADALVGDLKADDDLILTADSRSLWASRRNIRCRVSILTEQPFSTQGHFYTLMRWRGRSYHRVFTHQISLCHALPNARLVEHGGTTLQALPKTPSVKTAMVSLVDSTTHHLPGHRLCHRVAAWSRTACKTTQLYGPGYLALSDKTEAHAPFRYSVIVENSRSKGYFTEKLIDSMLCSNVPIYWGDPSIGSYFDPRGMVVCETQADIQKAIVQASSEDYDRRRPFVDVNQWIAKRLSRSMIHRACDILHDEQDSQSQHHSILNADGFRKNADQRDSSHTGNDTVPQLTKAA